MSGFLKGMLGKMTPDMASLMPYIAQFQKAMANKTLQGLSKCNFILLLDIAIEHPLIFLFQVEESKCLSKKLAQVNRFISLLH